MLKVCEPSPPVPTMSTRCVLDRRPRTLVANSRITCAAAVISPMVSFLTRRPTRTAAIITGLISPLMMRRTSESISSWKISRWSMVRARASMGVMAMRVPRVVDAVQRDARGSDPAMNSADRLNGAVDAGRIDVEVGHEAQTDRALMGEHAARLARCASEGLGAVALRDARRRRCWCAARRSPMPSGMRGQAFSQPPFALAWSSARRATWCSSAWSAQQRPSCRSGAGRRPAILRHAVERRRCNELARAGQRRAHRCAQALAEKQTVDAVEAALRSLSRSRAHRR